MGRLPADVVDLPESEGDLNDLRDEILEVIASARQRDHQAWIAAIRYKARVVAKLDRVLKAAAVAHQRPAQACYLIRAPQGAGLNLRVADFAFYVKNRVRCLGLRLLGAPVPLLGSGSSFFALELEPAFQGPDVPRVALFEALPSAGSSGNSVQQQSPAWPWVARGQPDDGLTRVNAWPVPANTSWLAATPG